MPKSTGNMFSLILKQVRRIPRGMVATYGDVAYAAGFPGAARQVAWALNSTKGVPVPWQRVVGAGGKILLAGESGFEQRMRLQGEGVRFNGLRIDMATHQFSFFKKKTSPAKSRTGTKKKARKSKVR